MPVVPRLVRAEPEGDVIEAPEPIAVIACLHWHDGGVDYVPALATAWTRKAVEVSWDHGVAGRQSAWIKASDVQRA